MTGDASGRADRARIRPTPRSVATSVGVAVVSAVAWRHAASFSLESLPALVRVNVRVRVSIDHVTARAEARRGGGKKKTAGRPRRARLRAAAPPLRGAERGREMGRARGGERRGRAPHGASGAPADASSSSHHHHHHHHPSATNPLPSLPSPPSRSPLPSPHNPDAWARDSFAEASWRSPAPLAPRCARPLPSRTRCRSWARRRRMRRRWPSASATRRCTCRAAAWRCTRWACPTSRSPRSPTSSRTRAASRASSMAAARRCSSTSTQASAAR